jgi:GNAT superfamily N-acetyltransferase
VSVQDLEQSIRFYSTLFGAEPVVVKADYAKWMLDDPRVNFAISDRARAPGVDHLGIQVESGEELAEIRDRLKRAGDAPRDQTAAICCYAESDKAWVNDPAGVRLLPLTGGHARQGLLLAPRGGPMSKTYPRPGDAVGMSMDLLTPDDAPAWGAFQAALEAAGLPTDDLNGDGQRFFSFEGGSAFGGFARQGANVLLRSIVVAPDRRGSGLGRQVVAGLLDEARRQGATAAWLLTTDAQGFFLRHGFEIADRATAPAAIAASAEFTSLCPTSAVLMCRKPL